MAEQTRRGVTLPLSGSFAGVDVAYLPTDRSLGVILEIFSGLPGGDSEPDRIEQEQQARGIRQERAENPSRS